MKICLVISRVRQSFGQRRECAGHVKHSVCHPPGYISQSRSWCRHEKISETSGI